MELYKYWYVYLLSKHDFVGWESDDDVDGGRRAAAEELAQVREALEKVCVLLLCVLGRFGALVRPRIAQEALHGGGGARNMKWQGR